MNACNDINIIQFIYNKVRAYEQLKYILSKIINKQP